MTMMMIIITETALAADCNDVDDGGNKSQTFLFSGSSKQHFLRFCSCFHSLQSAYRSV